MHCFIVSTCYISSVGQPGIFDFVAKEPILTASGTDTELLTRSVMALGSNFVQTQTMSATNSVAESIITFGVKYLGLKPYVKDPEYLRLYEAMMRGILDYEVRSSNYISSPLIHLIRPHTSVFYTQQALCAIFFPTCI